MRSFTPKALMSADDFRLLSLLLRALSIFGYSKQSCFAIRCSTVQRPAAIDNEWWAFDVRFVLKHSELRCVMQSPCKVLTCKKPIPVTRLDSDTTVTCVWPSNRHPAHVWNLPEAARWHQRIMSRRSGLESWETAASRGVQASPVNTFHRSTRQCDDHSTDHQRSARINEDNQCCENWSHDHPRGITAHH